MNARPYAVVVTLTVSLLLGCTSRSREVVVYTSVDQVVSEPILREFEKQSGLTVRAVFDTEETKSTGVLNRLVAEAAHPQADVFWSGDPVRPFVLIKRGLVVPYESPNAAGIPPGFRASDGAWTGFAARVRVLLVNTNLVPAAARPRSVRDLADPRWKGMTAIANPVFGTTTMHVAALFTVWGEQQGREFLQALKANQTRIASSNGEVKRLVASGEVALGVADTDDAQEALAEHAPIDVVFPDQDGIGTLVMPTTVSLMSGAPHADAGKKLIDHLLRPEVEARLAQAAAHVPVRAGVQSPPGVKRAGDFKVMQVDYSRVADEMERMQPWLKSWVGL